MSSKKIIEDTICNNVCMLEINYINQTEFNNYVNENNTPYIIDKSGYYKLTENIETRFFPNILDSLKLSTSNPNPFGHPAAFIISAKYVIFDLNGFAIYQSPQDYCVQRFFALIQLNLMPFNVGVGPITPETRTNQTTAEYCIIKNGVLGLSAHQSIMGNNNKNIIIEKINCEDFEVSGITLNNVENVYIENSVIGRSAGAFHGRVVPVSPTFAGLTFSHKLLRSIVNNDNTTSIKKNMALKMQTDIETFLIPIFNIIYTNTSLTNMFAEMKNFTNTNLEFKILFNKSGKSPCNMHGIKVTGPNPSIGAFHASLDDSTTGHSENINLNNIHIMDIEGCVDEEILCTTNGKVVHICAGLKAAYSIIENNVIKKLINTIYDLVKDDNNLQTLIKTNISKDSLDFINHGLNPTFGCGFVRGMDVMAHINKGIHGLRLGSCKTINLNNVKIKNIKNIGNIITEPVLEEIKLKFQGVDQIITADTTLFNNSIRVGSSSIGTILSGCKFVVFDTVDISNIYAPKGIAMGTVINNECASININNTSIYKLTSMNCCVESSTLVIDHKAKDITLNNTSIQ